MRGLGVRGERWREGGFECHVCHRVCSRVTSRTQIQNPIDRVNLLHPAPSTPEPQLETRNPGLCATVCARGFIPNLAPSTFNTHHSPLTAHHSRLNTQHSTLNTQHSTLNTQHSTCSRCTCGPRFTATVAVELEAWAQKFQNSLPRS